MSCQALFSINPVQPVLSIIAPVASEASVSLLSSEAGTALHTCRSTGPRMTSVTCDTLLSGKSWVPLLPRRALGPWRAPEAPDAFMSRAFTGDVTALSVRHCIDLFEDSAAHAVHPDGQRKFVSKPSPKLQQLQLGHVLSTLQRHHQESIHT